MTYETKKAPNGDIEIVMFVVVAAETVAGFRLPFLKTFSAEEALLKFEQLKKDLGQNSLVEIKENQITREFWRMKYGTPYPI